MVKSTSKYITGIYDDITSIEQSFQDGCSTIAAKITSLGVDTVANASIDTICNNIESLYTKGTTATKTITVKLQTQLVGVDGVNQYAKAAVFINGTLAVGWIKTTKPP